jgi:hypothetical protein
MRLGEEVRPRSQGSATPDPLPRKAFSGILLGRLKVWALWWLAFFGIYAASSVCPFCGSPGCPVGAGGAAAVGGFFTVMWQYGRNVLAGFVRFVKKLFGTA